jgi:hypothetical protein
MSDDAFKQTILAAISRALRPVARLLLATGVPYREFAQLCKRVFVAVASEEFGVSGRPTNVSRVSLMTGFARKEVKRLRDEMAEVQQFLPSLNKTTDATRLLTGWYQEAEYRGGDDRPLDLPVHGPAPSFEALHERFGGDVPATVMQKDLIRAGAVQVTDDGRLRPLTRYFMPLPMEPDTIVRAGDVLYTFGNTLTLNITRRAGTQGRFEGRASHPAVPANAVPEFRAFLEARGMQLLEEADAWLSEHAARSNTGHEATVRLGIGVYQILEESVPSTPAPTPVAVAATLDHDP